MRTLDLTAWAGETITLRFRFNPMDHFANEFLGWQVDNVRLAAHGLGGLEHLRGAFGAERAGSGPDRS